jgi:hypothetical protein
MRLDLDFTTELPYTRNFDVPAGDDLVDPWVFYLNGAIVDLTPPVTGEHPFPGVTLRVTLTDKATGAVVIDGEAVGPDNGPAGEFSTILWASQTASLSGVYVYKLVCIWDVGTALFPLGRTRTIFVGDIAVL